MDISPTTPDVLAYIPRQRLPEPPPWADLTRPEAGSTVGQPEVAVDGQGVGISSLALRASPDSEQDIAAIRPWGNALAEIPEDGDAARTEEVATLASKLGGAALSFAGEAKEHVAKGVNTVKIVGDYALYGTLGAVIPLQFYLEDTFGWSFFNKAIEGHDGPWVKAAKVAIVAGGLLVQAVTFGVIASRMPMFYDRLEEPAKNPVLRGLQNAMTAVRTPFEKLGGVVSRAGDKVAESGHPVLGEVLKYGGEAGAMGVPGAVIGRDARDAARAAPVESAISPVESVVDVADETSLQPEARKPRSVKEIVLLGLGFLAATPVVYGSVDLAKSLIYLGLDNARDAAERLGRIPGNVVGLLDTGVHELFRVVGALLTPTNPAGIVTMSLGATLFGVSSIHGRSLERRRARQAMTTDGPETEIAGGLAAGAIS